MMENKIYDGARAVYDTIKGLLTGRQERRYGRTLKTYKAYFGSGDIFDMTPGELRNRTEYHNTLADLCKCDVTEDSHRALAQIYQDTLEDHASK